MKRGGPSINRHTRVNQALHPDRVVIRLLRLAAGALALSGVGWNWYRASNGLVDETLIQSVSQFTNLANLALGLVLITEAVRRRAALAVWWDHLRGAAAFGLVMTGLIYYLLVAEPGELGRWDIEWSNLALHRILPSFALADWLVVTMTVRGGWGRPLAWLLFPIAYLVYTWTRGAFVGWYPYPFLDPQGEGGWGAVLPTTAMVLVAFLTVSLIVHLLGNFRASLAHRGR